MIWGRQLPPSLLLLPRSLGEWEGISRVHFIPDGPLLLPPPLGGLAGRGCTRTEERPGHVTLEADKEPDQRFGLELLVSPMQVLGSHEIQSRRLIFLAAT